jgi:hypothetical protein
MVAAASIIPLRISVHFSLWMVMRRAADVWSRFGVERSIGSFVRSPKPVHSSFRDRGDCFASFRSVLIWMMFGSPRNHLSSGGSVSVDSEKAARACTQPCWRG